MSENEQAASPSLDPLDRAAQAAFVRAVQFFEPRLWIFLNAEIEAAQKARIDPRIALLALANGLIDLAKGAMEVRGALEVAGGDADVAAMILGLRSSARLVPEEPESEPPPTRAARRRRLG